MNKVLLLLVISAALTGCSTVSEYNQGCRDGLTKGSNAPQSAADNFCNDLDKARKAKKALAGEKRPG